jgi:hypothetical protein
VPTFFLDFVLAKGLPSGATNILIALGDHIAYASAHPDRYVLTLRAIQIAISSAAPLLGFLIARRLSGSVPFAVVCAAVLAFEPALFQYSVMAVGEATGLTLALGGLASLIYSVHPLRFYWSGMCFAAAAGSKITIGSLVIFPILIIVAEKGVAAKSRVLSLRQFLAALAVGFLLCNPWVWTDPLRYAKAVIGNIQKPSTGMNLNAFLALWLDMTGVTVCFISVITILGAFYFISIRRDRVVLLGLVSMLVVILPTLLHANTSFSRYLLPALPCLLVIMADLYAATERFRQRYHGWRATWAILGALAIGGTFSETLRSQIQLRQPDDFMNALAYVDNIPKDVMLYVPQETMAVVRLQPSPACLGKMLAMVQRRMQDHEAILAFLARQGLPRRQSTTLISVFNEDEQALLGELNAREGYVGADSRDVMFYSDHPEERMSISSMNQSEAIDSARGQKCAILLPQLGLDRSTPTWRGQREWAWYRFN